jgi:hypothetical protein
LADCCCFRFSNCNWLRIFVSRINHFGQISSLSLLIVWFKFIGMSISNLFKPRVILHFQLFDLFVTVSLKLDVLFVVDIVHKLVNVVRRDLVHSMTRVYWCVNTVAILTWTRAELLWHCLDKFLSNSVSFSFSFSCKTVLDMSVDCHLHVGIF